MQDWADLRDGDRSSEALLGRAPRWAHSSVFLAVGLAAAAFAWAGTSEVEMRVAARGSIRPEGELLRVQTVAAGQVEELMVRQGDDVEANQVLLRIDGREVHADLDRVSSRLSVLARHLRSKEATGTRLRERNAAERRRGATETRLAQGEVARAEARLSVAEAELKQATAAEGLAQKQWEIYRRLGPEELAEVDRAAKAASLEDASAQVQVAEARIQVARDEIEIARERVEAACATAAAADQDRGIRLQEHEFELRELTSQVEDLRAERDKLEATLAHLEVEAPQAGTVVETFVRGAREVVQVGDTIATVVPQGVPWIVEAMVSNRDGGSLRERTGSAVKLKFDAFPFRDFGTLEGTLLRVSPDAVDDPIQGRGYQIVVSLPVRSVGRGRRGGTLELGMTCTVEIVKERGSVLELAFRRVRDRVAAP